MGEANPSSDTYLLARDSAETERLNEQHKIFTQNLGFVIHPSILKRLPADARVADVAAGSGAWTLNAAEIVGPDARVDAYDISSDQFPAEHPENVTFSVQDAKRPFPSHLHGTYDLVHVRALVAAMDPSDWTSVAQNLSTLLKQGGSLQWTEGDLSKLVCLRNGPKAVFFKAIPQLLALFNERAHIRTVYGAHQLPETFESAKLHSVQTDAISSDRVANTRSIMTSSYLVAMLGWARMAKVLTEDELNEMRLQIKKEIESGAYVRGDTFTTIGIK